MGRPALGQKTYPIRIREDAYRMVKTIEDEAKRHGHKMTKSEAIATACDRFIYRSAENEVTAWSKQEERMIKKLLAVMRQPGPPSVRRAIVRLIEELLDSRTARGVGRER